MTNALWDEWPGDTWTQTGNGLTETERVVLRNARDVPHVDDLGVLQVPVQGGQMFYAYLGADFHRDFGVTEESLPNAANVFNDALAAVRADVSGSGELYAYRTAQVTDSRGYPIIASRPGGQAPYTVEAGSVQQVRAVGTTQSVEGAKGYVLLTFTPDEDGTLEIAPLWYGAASGADGEPLPGVPESIDFPADPDPDPDPDPGDDEDGDPWDVLARQLAPKVAGYAGGKGDAEMIELAESQLPIVVAFVHGYTRGKGFDATDMPVRALRAVIVSAASRLVVNPEQVIQYSSGDYSETSARLLGFTIPERMTLNNYRRVSA